MSVDAAIAVVLMIFFFSGSITLYAAALRNRHNRKAPRNLPPSLADECSPWSDGEAR